VGGRALSVFLFHAIAISCQSWPFSSAEPYGFLVKLRNITGGKNALGMMRRRNPNVNPMVVNPMV
jgi:hypothetical protein